MSVHPFPLPTHAEQTSMGSCAVSCTNFAPNFNRAGFQRAIRAAFPVATAANLAAVTGQSLRAAYAQAAGEADPSAEALAACIAALGPAFLVQAVPGAAWAAGAARDETIDRAVDMIAQATATAPRRRTG